MSPPTNICHGGNDGRPSCSAMNVLYVRRHAQPQMRVLPVPKNLCIDIETFFSPPNQRCRLVHGAPPAPMGSTLGHLPVLTSVPWAKSRYARSMLCKDSSIQQGSRSFSQVRRGFSYLDCVQELPYFLFGPLHACTV